MLVSGYFIILNQIVDFYAWRVLGKSDVMEIIVYWGLLCAVN